MNFKADDTEIKLSCVSHAVTYLYDHISGWLQGKISNAIDKLLVGQNICPSSINHPNTQLDQLKLTNNFHSK